MAITCESHGRSAAELRERYDAEVWAPAGAVGVTQAPVTRPFAPGDRLPGGLEPLDVGFSAEVLFWIPAHATLVAGDAILGTPGAACAGAPTRGSPGDSRRRGSSSTSRPSSTCRSSASYPTHGDPVEQDAHAALRAAIEG